MHLRQERHADHCRYAAAKGMREPLLERLTGVKYCGRDRDEALTQSFARLVQSLDVRDAFNPSFYTNGELTIFAFRAIPNGEDRLASFVSVTDETGSRSLTEISSAWPEMLSVPRFIDPKLARINGEHYVTFNSGYVPGGNDIFVMKVHPELGAPRRVLYRGRQEQERNWAFFSEGGEVYALYRISPLTILRLGRADSEVWEMEEEFREPGSIGSLPRDLTIGTQLSKQDHRYHFIAHRKLRLLGKKIYLGKHCALDLRARRVSSSRYWLVHSLKDLLGSRTRHNTNLLSCTYFSGIQATGERLSLGYGVNDVRACFSTHRITDL